MTIFWESSTCLSISGSVSFYSRAFPKWFSHLWPSLLPNTYLLLLQTWLQWIRNRLYKFCDEIKILLGFFKIPSLSSSKIIILQKYLNSQHKLKIVCVDNTVKKEKSTTVWLNVRIQLTMAASTELFPCITLLVTLSGKLCNRSLSAPWCQWRNGER